MDKIVITIGREYGSKGREIGEKLAAALGINYYDKNLINLAAERSGIKEKVLEKVDETVANPLFTPYYPPGIDPGSVNDRLFKMESDIILEKADTESCVIVGRCANYLLADRPNCLHVYIFEDMEKRIKNIMQSQGIEDKDVAARLVRKNDKSRRSYYQYYTDWKWGGLQGYHILVDSGLMGIDGTVAMLKNVAERMQGK